ncbi:hypothetical protein FOA52_014661 [Chlamydomonas sp. UWO 241]|nr:hypothetical protein FOA52_014661 [Chlamydomonas sp. UWO 241]
MTTVVVQPRLETQRFSLYWREAVDIQTRVLADLSIQADPSTPLSSVLQAAAQQLGWADVDTLLRLEGFTEDWERVLCRGRSLDPSKSVAETLEGAHGAQEGEQPQLIVVFVRKELKADGWKIALPGDFLSDSDDDEEA